jgi:hypothetical protein
LSADAGEIIFEASLVVGDSLLIVFQDLSPDKVARMFLSLNLNNGSVENNLFLVSLHDGHL